MHRIDREKLIRWAWSQRISPHETLVLIDMALSCNSPFAQVAFCVRDFARRRQMDPKTVRRALAKLTEHGLISDRGKKPMDEYRYLHLYQLETEARVEGNDTPSSWGKSHPIPEQGRGKSHPESGEITPQVGGNGPPTKAEDGGNGTPLIVNTNTNSLLELNRGGRNPPTPEPDGGNDTPSPALANLPPNANRDLVRLMELYPAIAGEQSFAQADGELRERLREGHSVTEMVEGVKRYRAYIEQSETDPAYTMHLKRFLGPDKHFLKPWAVGASQRGRKPSRIERAARAYKDAGY